MLVTSYELGHEYWRVVEALLSSHDLVFENTEAKYRALTVYRDGPSVDFADTLIAETAKLSGARETVTFDRKAERKSGMRLLGSM